MTSNLRVVIDQNLDRVNRPNEHVLLVFHTPDNVFFIWVGHHQVAEDKKTVMHNID